MKKILLSATACLSMVFTINAQTIQPCGTYQARELHLKNTPGYAAKLNAAEAASAAEYQAFLSNQSSQRTSSLPPNYTFTVPVVFHILHLGSAMGALGSENINDIVCANALAQVNRDYGKTGTDTNLIDNLFKPLYVNSYMHFELAKLDPQGNCTNGVIHHYDVNSNWNQNDIFNYKYSTYATGNWNPSKYLNIYIVKNIIGQSAGTIVGYTYLPGTSPVTAADAIVYRNDFLNGYQARSLSHEIGHWFGLSHTFGSTNNAQEQCGNDDINDTPATTGFFSNCPKIGFNYTLTPTVTTPIDSSDITRVRFGAMDSKTALNSLTGTIGRNLFTMVSTTVSSTANVITRNATGIAGGYSDFSAIYGNDFNAGLTNTISITSLAKSTDNNYVGLYIDYNRNGNFTDGGEVIFAPTTVVDNYSITPIGNAFGSRTFGTPLKINKIYSVTVGTVVTTYTTSPDSFITVPATYIIPGGLFGIYRMRVVASNSPILNPSLTLTSGEFEDYNVSFGTSQTATMSPSRLMATCDTIRPNVENIMDYSSCPRMFTQGQTTKIRVSAESLIGNRRLVSDTNNLVFTGLLSKTFVSVYPNGDTLFSYAPTGSNACSPTADFIFNKPMACASQSISFSSISFNGTPTSYSWQFEGGTPSTSSSTAQIVNYSTPGTYTVSLTVSNSNGSSTKTSTVNINWNSDAIALPYKQDFEGNVFPPQGWNIRNMDNDDVAWESSNFGAQTSAKSAVLPNANYVGNPFGYSGNIDVLETPGFDFSKTTALSLSFDYTFARKTGVTTDEFFLQYSLDCGGTWSNVLGTPAINTMAASGGTVNAPYLPVSNTVPNPLWINKSISGPLLTGLANKRDVKFRFYFKNDQSGKSQNLYIDNFNISGVVSLNELANAIGLSIYPNPTNSSAAVEFTSQKDTKVNITVFDVTGRLVEANNFNATAGLTSTYTVNNSKNLSAGVYFITIEMNNQKVTQKLIIN